MKLGSTIMGAMDCRKMVCREGAASLAEEVWALLMQLAFACVHRRFAAAAAECQLAPTQALVLHELEPEGAVSMRDLAGRLKCDPSNVTGLADRLEARGLVERRPHESDRRVKGLALTPAGAKLRKQLAQALYQPPPHLASLSADDLARLRDLLLRLANEVGEPRAQRDEAPGS